MTIQLMHGDCLEMMRSMPDNSVDSIVTDPPYGLSFMGKKWDYDVPATEVWTEALRVLKPGGHLLAFAGIREGFSFIGIERDADYLAIAKQRIETASASLFTQNKPLAQSNSAKPAIKKIAQMELVEE